MNSADGKQNAFQVLAKNTTDIEASKSGLTDDHINKLTDFSVDKTTETKKIDQASVSSASHSVGQCSQLKKDWPNSLNGENYQGFLKASAEKKDHNLIIQSVTQDISSKSQPLKKNKRLSFANEVVEAIPMLPLDQPSIDSQIDGTDSIENEIVFFDVNQETSTKQLFFAMLKLSGPLLIIANVVTILGSIENQLIVALNDEISDAVNLITLTRSLFLALGTVTAITSILTVNARSANHLIEVGVIYRQSLLASLLFSVPVFILCTFPKPILLVLGQGTKAAEACEKYLHYFSLFNIPAVFFQLSVEQVLYGLKKQFMVTGFKLIGLPIFYYLGNNLGAAQALAAPGIILTDTIFIYGLLTAYHIYFLFSKEVKQYKFFSLSNLQNEMNYFKKIIKLGCPLVVDIFVGASQSYMLNLMVGWLGGRAPVIQNVSTQYGFYPIAPSHALAKSAGILISNALGEKRYKDIRRNANIHLAAGISTAISMSGVALFLIPQLTNYFIPLHNRRDDSQEELHDVVKTIIAINSISQVFNSARIILNGSLHGLSDTVYPALINAATLWGLSVPSAYILSTVFKMGINGIALGQCIGMLASNILLFPRWYKKSNPQQIETAALTPSNTETSIRRSINWCFWKKSTSTATAIDQQSQSYQTVQTPNAAQ